MDQWKLETAHRHSTIDGLRELDEEAMKAYYDAERRGQYLSLIVFLAVIGLAVTAVVLHNAAIGVAAVITGGASAIWAMRRRSDAPSPGTVDAADGDALEKSSDALEKSRGS